MRTWHVVRSPVDDSTRESSGFPRESDQYYAVLTRVPWWAAFTTFATDWVCGRTGHALCGGGKMLDRVFSRGLFCEDRREEEVLRFPVSAEVAVALEPLFAEWGDE